MKHSIDIFEGRFGFPSGGDFLVDEVQRAFENIDDSKFRYFYQEKQYGFKGQAGGEALKTSAFISLDSLGWVANVSFEKATTKPVFNFDRYKEHKSDPVAISAGIQWGIEHHGSRLANVLAPVILDANLDEFIGSVGLNIIVAGTKALYRNLAIDSTSANSESYKVTLEKVARSLPFSSVLVSLEEIQGFPGITCEGKSPNRQCRIN